jgi:transposase
MQYFVGLDVAMISSAICIVNEKGKIICESSIPTSSQSIYEYLTSKKLKIEKIALESGSLSHFLVKGLLDLGLDVVCMDSRSLSPSLQVKCNKTDRNDARGIAEALRTESKQVKYVHQKSEESVDLGVLLATRRMLVSQRTALGNTIKGLLKSFGVILSSSTVNTLEGIVREKLAEVWPSTKLENLMENLPDSSKQTKAPPIYLSTALEALIQPYIGLTTEIDSIDRILLKLSRKDLIIKRLMTVPGIGPLTALTYKVVIDDPLRFKKGRNVGAYLGMCATQYSSGNVKRYGRISKTGSKELRTLLASAGMSLLVRCKKPCALKDWGLKIEQKHGKKKAATAVGRKMAIIMHRIWIGNTTFISGITENIQASTVGSK